MADKKVVIIGGGVAGLIANYVVNQHRRVAPIVLEAGRVGGEWLSGGLRYIHSTPEMASMIIDIGSVFSNYTVRGGILLKGKVEPYPEVLRTLDPDVSKRIQHDHWRKTRQIEPVAAFGDKSMNDPEASGPRTALRTDAGDVLRRLVDRAIVYKEEVRQVTPGAVVTNLREIEYDYIIWTAPLWVAKKVLFFGLPDALAIRLNIVTISPMKIKHDVDPKKPIVGALHDPYASWDYVYTPYTPDNLIHRLSSSEDGYMCEFSGAWPEECEDTTLRLTNDLNSLFVNGWTIERVVRGLNGHLLPLPFVPTWPEHIQPLGRFAQWSPRATADVVLEHAFKMCANWGWSRYE